MSLEEFYDSIGGNYKQVFDQLGDDDVILEFLNKFFAKDVLKELKDFLSEDNYKDAFICVHNIKGYGLNMALDPLYKAADVLCEALRNRNPVADTEPIDTEPMMNVLENVYYKIHGALVEM